MRRSICTARRCIVLRLQKHLKIPRRYRASGNGREGQGQGIAHHNVPEIEARFSRDSWQHFYGSAFFQLYQRYEYVVGKMQRGAAGRASTTTQWWCRSWRSGTER
jgi:hypothetical protein